MNITKAIIPVAGWGTRRLPITKAIEKCMLPLGNRPLVDYVVQDCIAAGVTDIYFVVGEQSEQLQSYYRDNIALNDYLRTKNASKLLDIVRTPAASFHYIVQPSYGKYGTSVPIALCRDFIEPGEQFLAIMGDQSFFQPDGTSNARRLIELVSSRGVRSGLLGTPVRAEDIGQYGIIEHDEQDMYTRIIEHPMPGETQSTLNNASFYLFDQPVLDYISADLDKPHDAGKEYWLIDALNNYVADGNPVVVGEAEGTYLDCGNVHGWLHANQVVITETHPANL